MSAEKQIEKMAKDIELSYLCLGMAGFYVAGGLDKVARSLYRLGYRKQSEGEWISVEERLPEADKNVLVITANGNFKVARCNIYNNGTQVIWATNDGLGERAIAYWMPLPEPPKGADK